ncbi:hypothetical protein KKB18_00205 [bacterium]|nr:hypothetical protein [bacterium]
MSKFDPIKHHRHSIRLENYDYSLNGAYFVTLCTYNRECILGDIIDGEMVLNNYGNIVSEEWINSSKIRKELILDEFIIMPNHIHGITIIQNPREQVVGASGTRPRQSCGLPKIPPEKDKLKGTPRKSLGSFIIGFKASVTKRINKINKTNEMLLCQRNYYDHIIRCENELIKIRKYIQGNPINWHLDKENPINLIN